MSTTQSLLSSICVSPNAKLILSASTIICLHHSVIKIIKLMKTKTNCYNYDNNYTVFVSSDLRTDAFICVVTNSKYFPNIRSLNQTQMTAKTQPWQCNFSTTTFNQLHSINYQITMLMVSINCQFLINNAPYPFLTLAARKKERRFSDVTLPYIRFWRGRVGSSKGQLHFQCFSSFIFLAFL